MHGGGGAPAQVNDGQWRNQMRLYKPKEGIYLCPRAPTNTWNLWHQGHIDPMFDRLIENLIVFKKVNPEKVYLMGYAWARVSGEEAIKYAMDPLASRNFRPSNPKR